MSGDGQEKNDRSIRQNALSEIHFHSLTDPTAVMSSEDEAHDGLEIGRDDAQSVLSISISRTQTRLTSPKTPAAEKAAALETSEDGGFFRSHFDGTDDGNVAEEQEEEPESLEDSTTLSQRSSQGSSTTPQPDGATTSPAVERLPSPWRAGPRNFQKLDKTIATLRNEPETRRRRALSGPSSAWEGLQKLLSSLPSIPTNISSSLMSSLSPGNANNRSERPKVLPTSGSKRNSGVYSDTSGWRKAPSHRGVLFGSGPPIHKQAGAQRKPSSGSAAGSSNQLTFVTPTPYGGGAQSSTDLNGTGRDALLQSAEPSQNHHPGLKRSTSDNSLTLHRSLSHVPSLGDDSRFEHVQEQVNSRMKAIKDSFQDSNFKLPSLPSLPSMADLGFGSAQSESMCSRPRPGSRDGTVGHTSRHKTPLSHIPAAPLIKSVVQPARTILETRAEKRAASGGMAANSAATHPHFTKALEHLTGDVIVLGGYRGSILRSAEYPHRQLWVPIKVGLNLRKVDLEVGLNPEDEENMEERIIPGGMLTHIGPVDIARRLFKRLRASENARNGKLRVHDYGYDWRLSPHILSRKLIQFLERLPCNRPGVPSDQRGATVIAHSLGGLITRHAINQRPELVSSVLYAGVPYTCVNILGPLRNGDDVLLSSRVLTAQVNFSIRTSFALLPLDGRCFFDKHTKEQYHVDFFDVNTWIDYCLSPCVAPPLPPYSTPPPSGMSGIIGSMASVLPSLPTLSRKGSVSSRLGRFSVSSTADSKTKETSASNTASATAGAEGGASNSGMAPQMGGQSSHNPAEYDQSTQTSVSTAVTIPREDAIAYLKRTLAETKKFKEELAYRPELEAMYPPAAVIYGKSTPTVFGAKVNGRQGIKHADAYDELAFASGDGVVLARAAMVPPGYQAVRGGVVSSDRGHVTLLGDLEAVGKCLNALAEGKRKRVGRGAETMA
ncbi:hypothetical protein BJ546DRAFT_966106 [Cryomyces antarcticus]